MFSRVDEKRKLADTTKQGVPLTVEKFDLHPGPERFDDGVVETVADGSHGWDQSGLTGPVSEPELGALVGVDHRPVWSPVADGHP